MLSDGTYKADTVKVGQVVEEKDLGSMYVWIPRYAYIINADKSMDIKFLVGTTNKWYDPKTNKTEDLPAGYKIHPCFQNGTKTGYQNGEWKAEIRGIWVAKFEAGLPDESSAPKTTAVTGMGNSYYPVFQGKKCSYNNINVSECYLLSKTLTETNNPYGFSSSTDSHLIKNSEWGAVAYLCYSDCGAVPMTNGTGSLVNNSHWYNLYTGQGPKSESDEGCYNYDASHNYSTSNGVLSSTTRNVTGVYDMAGGAWERVAGYLDNGNGNLDAYGVSNDGTKYFEGGKLKSAYTSLWDKYDVSDEEKNNKVTLSDGTVETGLWDGSKTALKYQEARYKLTKYNYNTYSLFLQHLSLEEESLKCYTTNTARKP